MKRRNVGRAGSLLRAYTINRTENSDQPSGTSAQAFWHSFLGHLNSPTRMMCSYPRGEMSLSRFPCILMPVRLRFRTAHLIGYMSGWTSRQRVRSSPHGNGLQIP